MVLIIVQVALMSQRGHVILCRGYGPDNSTSSPDVTERPHDTLSPVASTVQYVEHKLCFKFTAAYDYNSVLFSSLNRDRPRW